MKKVQSYPLTAAMDVLALGLAIAALAPLFVRTGAGGRLAEIGGVLFGRLAPFTALTSFFLAAAAFARIVARYKKTSGLPWRAGFAFLCACIALLFSLRTIL